MPKINCESRCVTGELCGADISHPLADRWTCRNCYTTHCPYCEELSRHRCAQCQGKLCDNCEDTVYCVEDRDAYHAECLALVPDDEGEFERWDCAVIRQLVTVAA